MKRLRTILSVTTVMVAALVGLVVPQVSATNGLIWI